MARGFAKVQNKRKSKVILCSYETRYEAMYSPGQLSENMHFEQIMSNWVTRNWQTATEKL